MYICMSRHGCRTAHCIFKCALPEQKAKEEALHMYAQTNKHDLRNISRIVSLSRPYSARMSSRATCSQETVSVTVGSAHLRSGDGRHGLVRQVLQDRAAPRDEAAVPGRQRRRPVLQVILHMTESLF